MRQIYQTPITGAALLDRHGRSMLKGIDDPVMSENFLVSAVAVGCQVGDALANHHW